ncbi:hypothetical protein CDL12_12255 [Handroanthus impetiginosus]|uniref:Uncharacterized protein n=1 Tax=Handroanthus impetiginosus TaxID=429701 RepID=A0A2G9HC37_9LAMI|nr:hypothetical protein CDL12_12255 [Handroanthus impetiginosus]
MELDFDKYCVVDRSPTTVLPAPRPRSKVANRKSNGKPKCGNDKLNFKEEFTEISFNRYRSASCRDARSRRADREGGEVMKRGSVYESSKEVIFRKRTDDVVGRKKIEFSRGSSSTFSFGIIDSLCSPDEDEDNSLLERNRSSVISLSEQSTSSCCKNQRDLQSRDSINCSFYPIPGRVAQQNTSSSDRSTNDQSVRDIMVESAVAPVNDGNVLQERDPVINLHKSLSAKLALPHSPAQSERDGSKTSSPKARFSPVGKMFDPFVKSKSNRSLSSYAKKTGSEAINETACKPLLNDLSDKPYNSQCEKKETLNPFPPSSPAHLHGLLKWENKHGMPFFEFSVKSPEDVYIAKTWKVDNALTWVYTFHSLHHRRKSNASGWGFRDNNRESTMIGQMLVSCYLCTELKGAGAFNDSMVTEFVLYDIVHSRKNISSQDNSSCSPDVSKAPMVSEEILSCEPNELSAKTKNKGQLSSPSKPLAAAELHPQLEIAAIVMQVPIGKRESLKFKTGDRKSDKPLPNLLDLCQLEQEKEEISDISRSGTMHVVIPDGNHGLPSTESRGPSPLLDRWRLGGGCDCGGWDMACPLNVFGNPHFWIADGQSLMDNQHPAELFVQGRKDDIPAFTMRATEDGKYAVDFHAQLSSLQAFSICVAVLHAAEASTAVGQERSKQMLQSDSLRVFAEEEVKNLMDAIAEEEKVKVNKKTEEVLTSFVLNPPFSPIARV